MDGPIIVFGALAIAAGVLFLLQRLLGEWSESPLCRPGPDNCDDLSCPGINGVRERKDGYYDTAEGTYMFGRANKDDTLLQHMRKAKKLIDNHEVIPL